MINFGNSLSGLNAASTRLGVAGNNLANINTNGYKNQNVTNATTLTGGVRTSSVTSDLSQGPITVTGNSFDLAVNGSGYLSVNLPNGNTGYTRSGTLQINNQGNLTDVNGNTVNPGINVPGNATSLSVNSNGGVTAMVNGQPQNLGQISLTTFSNPDGLNSLGNSLFAETNTSGQPITGVANEGGRGSFVSGGVEASNVNIAENIINLILSKASFSANIKSIQAGDEITKSALDIVA
ncbi:MAG: flagellar hook-basal body complex protein [Nitrospinae bacterium]|nr:flagellar hook-basal body complex protein [Nitrospinota bacterium]